MTNALLIPLINDASFELDADSAKHSFTSADWQRNEVRTEKATFYNYDHISRDFFTTCVTRRNQGKVLLEVWPQSKYFHGFLRRFNLNHISNLEIQQLT